MRADYLTRWHDLFAEGGFRRLMRDGTWFQNCHYTYADTTTGPGHASLATGCLPAEHGIVANDWYDRRAAKVVYCVDSDRYVRVPPAPARQNPAATSKKRKIVEGAVSPERLLATFGDLLKAGDRRQVKVVSLSFKDRSARSGASIRTAVIGWIRPLATSLPRRITATGCRVGRLTTTVTSDQSLERRRLDPIAVRTQPREADRHTQWR